MLLLSDLACCQWTMEPFEAAICLTLTVHACSVHGWQYMLWIMWPDSFYSFYKWETYSQFGPAYGSMQCMRFLASFPGCLPTQPSFWLVSVPLTVSLTLLYTTKNWTVRRQYKRSKSEWWELGLGTRLRDFMNFGFDFYRCGIRFSLCEPMN